MNPIKDKLITMLRLQDGMNCKVHPEWIAQRYEWYRAAWVECAELLDHQGYKWWKKQIADRDQVVLEVIDIWHFGLSAMFEADKSYEQIAEEIVNALDDFSPEPTTVHQATEALAQRCLETKRVPVQAFWQLMHTVDLSFDDLFVIYVGKNVLNLFRQDHGYKDGSYRKVWDGREDNEHLAEIVAALDHTQSDFGDALYQALLSRYEALPA